MPVTTTGGGQGDGSGGTTGAVLAESGVAVAMEDNFYMLME